MTPVLALDIDGVLNAFGNGTPPDGWVEAMLAYVTVTRAKLALDRSGLAWVDDYLPAGAR